MAGNITATGKGTSGHPELGDDKGGLLGGNGVDDLQPGNQAAAPQVQTVDDKGAAAGAQGLDDGAAH